jgi:hypothetical protein
VKIRKEQVIMKRLVSIFSIGLLLILSSISSASGESTTSGWYTIPEAGTSVGVLGATFAEDLSDTMDGASSVSFNNAESCESVDDPSCAGGYAQMLLPPCEVDQTASCVELLELTKDGEKKSAKLLRVAGKRIVKGNPAIGIPNGYNSSLWKVDGVKHAGGVETYAVYVMYRVSLEGKLLAFRARVTPYLETLNSKVKELTFKEVTLASGRRGIEGINPAHGCAWTEDGICGEPSNFAPGTRINLKLKISNSVVGFLNGRLQEPTVELSKINENYQSLSVSGNYVEVQKVYGKVLTEKADSKVLGLFNFEQFKRTEQYLNTYLSTGTEVLQTFDSLQSILPEKAESIRTYWGFASAASSSHACLQSSSKILGLVTTNAMIYDSKPPTFTDGELQYRVAGVHSKPDGSDFKGVYDLVLDSTAARCLYKYSNAPISATVSVTSSTGGLQSVATTVVNERNGWLHLGAYGFGFSSPTLKVKLTQEAPASSPSASVATVKKTSITCVKGKNMKKVTAVNPKCPTGYKKKAA